MPDKFAKRDEPVPNRLSGVVPIDRLICNGELKP